MNFFKKYKVVHFLVVFLFLVIVVGVIVFSHKSKASSTAFNLTQGNCSMTGNVSLNKSSYTPYETIIASASIYVSGSTNGVPCTGGVSATNPTNNFTTTLINAVSGNATGQYNSFNAIQSGTSYISFLVAGSAGSQNINVYYAVNTPTTPIVNVWITSSLGYGNPVTSITNGSNIVVHWTSSSNSISCALTENGTFIPGTTGTSGTVTRTPSPSDGKDFVYKVNCNGGSGTPGTGIANLKIVPSVVVNSSPSSIPLSGSSTISWTSQGASSCEYQGQTKPTNGNIVVSPSTPTPYIIKCSEAPQFLNGTCSGSYTNTIDGSCAGIVNGSICNSGGSPWEGDDCSDFGSQNSCPMSGDPWCNHGCSWKPPTTTTISCAGLNQTSCGSHTGCVWNPGNSVAGDFAESSAFVTINNSTPTVEIKITDLSGNSINSAPYMSMVSVHWIGSNMSSSEYECDKENDGTFTDGVFGSYPIQVSTPVSSTFSRTVKCRKKATPATTYTDTDSIAVTGSNSPDLTITSLSPSSATVPSVVAFTATVKNTGSASTVASFYNLFQTATGLDDAGNPVGVVDFKVVPKMTAIDAGGTKTTSKTISLASDVKFIRACADKSGAPDITGLIAESDENNNCIAWKQLMAMPELIASAPTYTATTNTRQYRFKSNITNQGNVSTGADFFNIFQFTDTDPSTSSGGGLVKNVKSSIVSFFVSKVYASWPTSDLQPAEPSPLPALAGNTTVEVNRLYTLPSATANKTIWVRTCADRSLLTNNTNLIIESNESNNCSSWTSFIVGSTSINGACNSTHYNCIAGTSINQASNPTSWTWNCSGAYGGSNSGLCTQAKQIMSGTLTPASSSCVIPKGQSTCNINFSWTVTNPESVGNSAVTKNPPAINNIVGRGDSKLNIPFSVKYNSETFFLYNNAILLDTEAVSSLCESGSNWNGTICSDLPDLIAENITPSFIKKGIPTKVYATITNQGGAVASNQFLNSFSLADNSAGNNPSLIGSSNITSLDSNSSQGISVNHTFNSVGDVYIQVCADSNEKNNEESDTNNCSLWTKIEIFDGDIQGRCSDTHYFCQTPSPAINKVPGTETTPWEWDCPGTGTYSTTLTACTETCYNCGGGSGVCEDPQAVNYPLCTVGNDGKCLNGLSNPPKCKKAPMYIER